MLYRPAALVLVTGFFLSGLAAQPSFRSQQDAFERVRTARQNTASTIDSLFKRGDLPYPPKNILLVVYKSERVIELWAEDLSRRYHRVRTYPMTAFSGELGPKRRRGDLQIPEGFYHINHFNPFSTFHLSLGLDYPNQSDRRLKQEADAGGAIYIHGSAVTIGCIPIGDAPIEELYIVAVDARAAGQTEIPVHIFPCRMDSAGMTALEDLAGQDTLLVSFWRNLQEGYERFSRSEQPCRYQVSAKGRYLFLPTVLDTLSRYTWLDSSSKSEALDRRISPPRGYERRSWPAGSFAAWLQTLPLKRGLPPVLLYDGTKKPEPSTHYAVIDMDVGNQDLQQCADAIIRLYAEFLYSRRKYEAISFKLTNGDHVGFKKWADGLRPSISGNVIRWSRRSTKSTSYRIFRSYLEFIFKYAGTASLAGQTGKVEYLDNVQAGDFLIQPGFPGHAMIIVDVADKPSDGAPLVLLAQSFMPAQEMHIVKNLEEPGISPWFRLPGGDRDVLRTPDWEFGSGDFRRFIGP